MTPLSWISNRYCPLDIVARMGTATRWVPPRLTSESMKSVCGARPIDFDLFLASIILQCVNYVQ